MSHRKDSLKRNKTRKWASRLEAPILLALDLEFPCAEVKMQAPATKCKEKLIAEDVLMSSLFYLLTQGHTCPSAMHNFCYCKCKW